MSPWKMPIDASDLTLTTRAKVFDWKQVASRKSGDPQIEFHFKTLKGNTFILWMTITSVKQVETFLEAGIIQAVGKEEFDVVPLKQQPTLVVQLEHGKLVKFSPIPPG